VIKESGDQVSGILQEYGMTGVVAQNEKKAKDKRRQKGSFQGSPRARRKIAGETFYLNRWIQLDISES